GTSMPTESQEESISSMKLTKPSVLELRSLSLVLGGPHREERRLMWTAWPCERQALDRASRSRGGSHVSPTVRRWPCYSARRPGWAAVSSAHCDRRSEPKGDDRRKRPSRHRDVPWCRLHFGSDARAERRVNPGPGDAGFLAER